MACTTPKTVFFLIPRTGGTWVETALKRLFGKQCEKMVCDFGWDLPINGIHIPPTAFKNEIPKFTFTFVRHPFDWYASYYQFLEKDKSWNVFVNNMLGKYSKLVKKFEQVDFVGRTENLYFDLCKALEMAGEEFDESKIPSQHVNRSIPKAIDFSVRRKDIVEAESYVMEKYYENGR